MAGVSARIPAGMCPCGTQLGHLRLLSEPASPHSLAWLPGNSVFRHELLVLVTLLAQPRGSRPRGHRRSNLIFDCVEFSEQRGRRFISESVLPSGSFDSLFALFLGSVACSFFSAHRCSGINDIVAVDIRELLTYRFSSGDSLISLKRRACRLSFILFRWYRCRGMELWRFINLIERCHGAMCCVMPSPRSHSSSLTMVEQKFSSFFSFVFVGWKNLLSYGHELRL